MQSKTSFYNKTIFKKDLKGLWPFWALEIFVSLIFVWACMGMYMITYSEGAGDLISSTSFLDSVRATSQFLTSPIVASFASILATALVYRFLGKRRSAYMMYALPVKRETAFVSHYLAGLVIVLIPYGIAYVATFLMQIVSGTGLEMAIMGCMVETFAQILFFYTLAQLVMAVSGNGIMCMVIYGVLNVITVFLDVMVDSYAELCVPITVNGGERGYIGSFLGMSDSPLWPLGYLTKIGGIVLAYDKKGNLYYPGISKMMPSIGMNCLYLIPTVILFVLARYLFKKRPAEKVGEHLAFSWCAPVFNAVFSICGGCFVVMFFDGISMSISGRDFGYFSNFIRILISVILCVTIMYFVAEMIIQKRFMIWKKCRYLHLGIILAVMVVGMIAIRTGVGMPKPGNPEDIKSIQVRCECGGSQNFRFTDKQDIKKILAIEKHHRKILWGGGADSVTVGEGESSVVISWKTSDGSHYKEEYTLKKTDIADLVTFLVDNPERTDRSIFGNKDNKIDTDTSKINIELRGMESDWNDSSIIEIVGNEKRKGEDLRRINDKELLKKIYEAVREDIRQGVFLEDGDSFSYYYDYNGDQAASKNAEMRIYFYYKFEGEKPSEWSDPDQIYYNRRQYFGEQEQVDNLRESIFYVNEKWTNTMKVLSEYSLNEY